MHHRVVACTLILFVSWLWQALPEQVAIAQGLPRRSVGAQSTGLTSTPTGPASPPAAQIQAPGTGQAVQGVLVIRGTAGGDGFRFYQLDFTYHDHPADNWFPLYESQDSVTEAVLGEWDTTMISDGDYDLRLTVYRQPGAPQVAVVNGIRVRNYTAVETSTPTPVTPTATTAPGERPAATLTNTPTATPLPPSPTPLPPNPAQLAPNDLAQGFGQGALAAAGLFVLLGLYYFVRGMRRP